MLSTAGRTVVRKGKPAAYAMDSEREYPTEDPAPCAPRAPHRSDSRRRNSSHLSEGAARPNDQSSGSAAAAAAAAAPRGNGARPDSASPVNGVSQRRTPATSASAKHPLQRHKEVMPHIQALLHLLLRGREAGGTPPTSEEMRPVLEAIRDYCVSVNSRSKRDVGGCAVGCPEANGGGDGDGDDGLNGFFAIVFLSTLFFANETEGLLRDSLQGAVDRLRAAAAQGREEPYHNAVVDAVNAILVFTPLTAPPVWLLDGCRWHTAESPVRARETSHEVASVPSRRASVHADESAASAMEDVAAVVAAMLHKMDDGDAGEAKEHMRTLSDDCVDYLSSEGGVMSFDEQHWFDVWLSALLKGYCLFVAAASPEGHGGANAVGTEEGEAGDRSVLAAVPTLLPRPSWRSSADNAYAQFAVQLLAVFFARGSDGSLNYCARVHRLVQYYDCRLRQSVDGGCAPIPTKNADRPPAPQQYRSLPEPEKLEEEAETTPQRSSEVAMEDDEAAAVEMDDDDDDDDDEAAAAAGRRTSNVVLFRPSAERGRTDSNSNGEEPEEPEELLEPISGGFSRFHRCYTGGNDPDVAVKRRISVEPEEYPVEEPPPPQAENDMDEY